MNPNPSARAGKPLMVPLGTISYCSKAGPASSVTGRGKLPHLLLVSTERVQEMREQMRQLHFRRLMNPVSALQYPGSELLENGK